ncbi:MAG TPA: BREX-1 system adenine-specific DNA-methyltransferase PglX [Thermotogota bacterium]|nr:BREX-1 system adenine-specific DNA-methyltransferase PglX [Thermotogota bacterium]
MELKSAILQIRERLERSYPLLLKQCGMTESADRGVATAGFQDLRDQILPILQADETQLGRKEAWKKFVQEAAFTTLNRLIGLKAMEARGMLDRATIAKRAETGGKSEAHYLYLSEHPEDRDRPGQGINAVLTNAFGLLAQELPQLYNHSRYGFLPRPEDTAAVIDLINAVDDEEWLKDDIVGWVYQYYQEVEKNRIYDEISKGKRVGSSYELVSVTQFYTEDYIVRYLLDNTLGRYWLEMHPASPLIKRLEYYDTRAQKKTREIKPVEEITVVDPACGSGHFLLYAMELLYNMYLESGCTEDIPKKIIENNLHGLDIDERAIQLTALSLYLKAKSLSKNARLTRSNLYALSSDHFEETDLMISMGFGSLSNSALGNLMDTLKSLKKLNMVGSLFRMKPMGSKKKAEKTPALFDRSSDAYIDRLVQKMVETIEEKLPAQKDAISALLNEEYAKQFNAIRLLLKHYDIVVTNPPYRDSGTLSEEMKNFLKDYYPDTKSDMYSAFIEKCLELTAENGLIGMVTMQSFMFISSHEKLRKLLLEKASIPSLAHLGPRAFKSISGEIVNTVAFVLEKGETQRPGSFHDVKDIDYEKKIETLRESLAGRAPSRAYTLHPSEFKKIPGDPFVYWISDRIRGLFTQYGPLEKYAKVAHGMFTGDNDRFLRYWWEVAERDISVDYSIDRRKWVPCAKGGPYNKWYGNLWWVVNWENGGFELKNFPGYGERNPDYYFKEGLTYTVVSSKGLSIRYMPKNHIFDHTGNCFFEVREEHESLLGIILSRPFVSMCKTISGSVSFEVGELKKVPIPDPFTADTKCINPSRYENFPELPIYRFLLYTPVDPITLSGIAEDCIAIKKALYAFHIMERDFRHDPLTWALSKLREEGKPLNVTDALKTFFRYKAELEARLLLNEALNDELVFKLYGLLPDEMTLTGALAHLGLLDNPETGPSREAENGDLSAVLEVLTSEGVPVGAYPPRALTGEERAAVARLYLNHRHDRGSDRSEAISGMDFGIVEELSAAFKVSPLTVAQEIALIEELPPEAAKDALSEHIQALAIDILRKDPDGILPLGADTSESSLRDRIIEQWRAMGIGQSYHELENLLGKRLEAYLLKDFFKDHSKRFQNRPILWHLVSDEGNVNFFILHHAWSYDRLLLLKSKYLGDVKRALDNTLATETDEMKREKLIQRMAELERFADTLGALLDGSYQPKTDDGVAKNIAPLQHKGLLKYNPLSGKMVDKMLKVKW